MPLFGIAILCFELASESWSSIVRVAEREFARRETLLVRAWLLNTGLSLQREADEQSLVATPPFSVNCVLLDLLHCISGQKFG